MWLIILALFINGSTEQKSNDQNSNILSTSRKQARVYLQNIRKSKNLDYNLWALARLSCSNRNLKQYVEKQVENIKSDKNPLSSFHDINSSFNIQLKKVAFQIGSYNLLAAFLLKLDNKAQRKSIYHKFISSYPNTPHSNVRYHALCKAIIYQNKITPKILPNKKFHLLHFFILFDTNYKTYFSNNYLSQITKNWNEILYNQRQLKHILSNFSLFGAYYLTGKYSQTNSLYHLITNSPQFPNCALKLKLYRLLDYSMYQLGYYNRNLEIARRFTIPLAKYLNKSSLLIQIKFSKANNLYKLGNLHKAEKIYESILNDTKEKKVIPLSILNNNLGVTYIKLGKYDQYLTLQLKALHSARTKKNYEHQSKIYNNLYLFYRKNGNLQKAYTYLQKSKNIAQQLGDSTRLGKVFISNGTFFRTFRHNLAKAQQNFSKAAHFLNSQDDADLYLNLLNEQADTYEKRGQYHHALEKYNRILSLTKDKDQASHLDALVSKASVELKMGNLTEAKKLIKKYKSADLNTLDFSQIVKARTVEARYKVKTNHPEDAIAILNPAISQITHRARNSADPQTGFWHVEDEYINAFAFGVSTLRQVNKPKKAIKLLEKLKTINDKSLYQSPLVRASQLNEAELTQYKKLTNKLDAYRKKLLTASKRERFQIQENIDFLKSKKQKLDDKITRQAKQPDISIRRIQQRLTAHDLILDITVLKRTCYIAHITRSKVSISAVPFGSNQKKLFSGALKKLASRQTNLDSLYAITKILGLKEIPGRINKITVIPDNFLSQLPIDVLPLKKPRQPYSYGQAHYVVEQYQTRYTTSLNSLSLEKAKRDTQKYRWNFAGYGVSKFGPHRNANLVPLPHAKSEIKNITRALTNINEKETFLNHQSTKASFEKVAPHARILHMATHSYVSERDPLFSTIYMSSAPGKQDSSFDNEIFAYELFSLKLNNSMIMLNSCESGSGNYIQGAGITGLSRALRYAGARSLVLNRWSVNDKLAADFATHFYAQLNEGKSRSSALQNTKRYFLKTQNANPFYWGTYTLIGEASPLIHPYREANMTIAKIFIIYFLAIAGLSIAVNSRFGQRVFNKRGL